MASEKDTKPIYKHVARELRSELEAGHFQDGEPLPTEADLQRRYGVSRHTIRQAFQDLVGEGLVYRLPGQGTFATGLSSKSGRYVRSVGTIEDLMAWSGTQMSVISAVETVEDDAAAARLQVPTSEVSRIVVSRIYETTNFVVTYIYVSTELGQRLKEHNLPGSDSRTIIGLLEQFLPYSVAGVNQRITAMSASEEVAELIGCEAQSPILHVERTYFDSEGKNVELAISYYNPERYSYQLQLRRNLF